MVPRNRLNSGRDDWYPVDHKLQAQTNHNGTQLDGDPAEPRTRDRGATEFRKEIAAADHH
jgi:hypothetical protein